MIKELTCINCPMGCTLKVEIPENGETKVSGYTCNRGLDYGLKEVTNPRRTVTSTVRVKDGVLPVVPVKTGTDIPKDLIFRCIEELSAVTVSAPVKIGDIIVENILGTGSDIVATRNVDRIEV